MAVGLQASRYIKSNVCVDKAWDCESFALFFFCFFMRRSALDFFPSVPSSLFEYAHAERLLLRASSTSKTANRQYPTGESDEASVSTGNQFVVRKR
jgi:hypothetical protein